MEPKYLFNESHAGPASELAPLSSAERTPENRGIADSRAGFAESPLQSFQAHWPLERSGESGIPEPALLRGQILVADDEEGIRELTSLLLSRFGLTPLTAATGSEAEAALQSASGQIVCILLDMSLPGTGGRSLYDCLHSLYPHIPIILMSGYSKVDAPPLSGAAGLTGFLQKPFSMDQLRDIVARALAGTNGPDRPA